MKPIVVIINGCKGSGKSTATNWLREQMINTNLFRNSGHGKVQRDDICPEDATFYYFKGLLDTMISCERCGYNFVWDGSFITEQVYCDLALGSKDYDFTACSKTLMMDLNNAVAQYYDVHIVQLFCGHRVISERLNGRHKGVYDNISFTSANSMKEQTRYLEIMDEYADKYHNITFHHINSEREANWKYELKQIVGSRIKDNDTISRGDE